MTSWAATAAQWPERSLHFITTSAAGSPLDTMMRALAKELGEILGQTIVVENRPGGTGAVGMNMALNAPADGYTVVSATGSTSFLMAEKGSRFHPSDFIFLRALQTEPSSVAVRKDSPFHSMKDLVEALKRQPDKVNIGGFATAGFHQYVLYRLEQKAGFKSTWVPYQGGNQALLALMGGHLDAAVITPSTAMAQIRSGDVRLLGISSESRSEFFPDIPTFVEQGYDVVETLWRGVMVVKGTPPDVTAKLVRALEDVEKRPSWQAFMRENMQDRLPLPQPELQKFVEKEVADRRQFLMTLQK
ncbi:MAG: tripartite tricarboxylate transporter substrate binding protein [Steroidobacteraceae bacterium]|nr:tripartite tricarboxylate transporter substrate binding protein [Steroidobacteraceae bacterium]